MDNTTCQLLELLSIAIGTKQDINIDMQGAYWDKLFELSCYHNIIPMIYEAAKELQSFINLSDPVKEMWKQASIQLSMSQLYRTMEFLKIYDKLNQAEISALLIKGIVCRQLYPNPYYRSSGDEDVYIRRSDFDKVDEIFHWCGLIRQRSRSGSKVLEQVTTYKSPETNLEIELHVDLFRSESELFGPMNDLFQNAFSDSIRINIDDVSIQTLSFNHHLLYLILHSIKHFLNIGFGIRQVCDIVMFCNAYGQEVDWEWLWREVTKLRYEVFVLNLFDIGAKYLGLASDRVSYPKTFLVEEINSENLLKDIMAAGIFGKSNSAQAKSGSITMRTALSNKSIKSYTKNKHSSMNDVFNTRKEKDQKGRFLILRVLFPKLNFMGSHYPYCRRFPLLLPIAWTHRFIVNLIEQRNPRQAFIMAGNSIEIGRRRAGLLKEYRMAGRHHKQLL